MKQIGTQGAQSPTATRAVFDETAKRTLLMELATALVGSPQDTRSASVGEAKSTLESLREQTKALERELEMTLSDWCEVSHYYDRKTGSSGSAIVRRNKLNGSEVVAIRGDRRVGWVVQFFPRESPVCNTFHHMDLDVVKAMSDLMARVSGYRMVDDARAPAPPASAPSASVDPLRRLPDNQPRLLGSHNPNAWLMKNS